MSNFFLFWGNKELMRKSKVGIIGFYGKDSNRSGGQEAKTYTITKTLSEFYGSTNIITVDTLNWKRHPFKLFFKTISAVSKCKTVVILPAHNGVRFFVPILTFFNRFYKRKLFYAVIGGWLPQYLQDKPKLLKKLKKFDGIYVETNTMRVALEAVGLTNVKVMPNCKELKILSANEMIYAQEEPYKLCTFSRVMREKGIEDALNAVKAVNEKFGRTVYTLDIYGQIDGEQTEWFETLQKMFPDYVRYGGFVPFDQSVQVLKNYFALLFPTYYDGEGFAGTIIDAFASGVPVLASDWRYNPEIIQDGETGLIYQAKNLEMLIEKLCWLIDNKEQHEQMKQNCLNEAKKYQPTTAIQVLVDDLGN